MENNLINSAASLGRKVHSGTMWIRLILTIVTALMGFLLAIYAVSSLITENGEYTISIAEKDAQSAGISLSETQDFANPTVRLKCPGISSMTNISGQSLPKGIDDTDGSHNGTSYIAYTFYLKNNAQSGIKLKESMTIDSTLLGADEAVRVRVYRNGIPQTYAKVSKLGTPEYGTAAFSGDYVYSETVEMSAQKTNKYTIVIWLEGDDPECLDNIKGGAVNLSMVFAIDESTA